MSWIEMIDRDKAGGRLARIYSSLADPDEDIARILKVHSLKPDILRSHLSLYREIMFADSNLSRAEREMVAVKVSAINGCHY